MSYSLLSKYYDELVRFDYEGYLSFIARYLPKGKGLDLACGSGTLTTMLAARGLTMTGLDNSEEMLSLAAARARKSRNNILFIAADVNGLKISKKYDLVISSCDGLNYVSSASLLKSLVAEVYNALNAGGVFIFDISTLKKAREVLDGSTFYEDTDDYTLLWTNKLEDNVALTEVTLFEQTGKNGLYNRYDENFEQFFYKNEEVIAYIEAEGFTADVFDGETYGPLTSDSDRLLVVARK